MKGGGKLIEKDDLNFLHMVYNLCMNKQNWNGRAKVEREKNTHNIIYKHTQNKSSIFSTIKNIPLVLWVFGLFK